MCILIYGGNFMKKLLSVLLAAVMLTAMLTVSVSAETVDEGELIISLFDPTSETVDPWLANVSDALTIEEVEGKTALKHATWDTSWGGSLSIKRYYEVDWSQYEYDKVLLVFDIYVNATPEIDYDINGELKIKFGDSADTNGNTTDMYQYYESCVNLEFKNGWNHIELPLCELYNNENSDELWRESDWFCLWMKSTFHTFDVAIARADFVATSESLIPAETEAPETEAPETEAPETEAPVTEAPDTEAPVTEAPETEVPAKEGSCGSSMGIAAAIVSLVSVLGCAVIKRR